MAKSVSPKKQTHSVKMSSPTSDGEMKNSRSSSRKPSVRAKRSPSRNQSSPSSRSHKLVSPNRLNGDVHDSPKQIYDQINETNDFDYMIKRPIHDESDTDSEKNRPCDKYGFFLDTDDHPSEP